MEEEIKALIARVIIDDYTELCMKFCGERVNWPKEKLEQLQMYTNNIYKAIKTYIEE